MRYKPKRQFQDEQFIDAVKNLVMASSGDVSKQVGCTHQLASIRLQSLVKDGILKRSMVGGMWVYQV